MVNKINYTDKVKELESIQKMMRKKRSRKSRLDKHRDDIAGLCQAGGSLNQIVIFLKREKRCSVHRSTLASWLGRNKLRTLHEAPPKTPLSDGK